VKQEVSKTDMVGGLKMTIAFSEPSPESQARWEHRADALAAWLLAESERERSSKSERPGR
jgi:hypothetical protein